MSIGGSRTGGKGQEKKGKLKHRQSGAKRQPMCRRLGGGVFMLREKRALGVGTLLSNEGECIKFAVIWETGR